MTEAEREAQWERIEGLLRDLGWAPSLPLRATTLESSGGTRRPIDEKTWERFIAAHPELSVSDAG